MFLNATDLCKDRISTLNSLTAFISSSSKKSFVSFLLVMNVSRFTNKSILFRASSSIFLFSKNFTVISSILMDSFSFLSMASFFLKSSNYFSLTAISLSNSSLSLSSSINSFLLASSLSALFALNSFISTLHLFIPLIAVLTRV